MASKPGVLPIPGTKARRGGVPTGLPWPVIAWPVVAGLAVREFRWYKGKCHYPGWMIIGCRWSR
jgi:hypothetical protein